MRRDPLAIPVVATLLIHGLFAAGLDAAEHFAKTARRPPPMEVTFEVKPAPPPPAPPAVEPPPPPAERPPVEEPKPQPRKKVASVRTPPKARATPEIEPPAPGPADDEAPAPQRIYVMPGGGMAVDPGPETGKATGRPGGKGTGSGGGGGPPGSTGSARAVPLASVKRMPEALGDYDLSKDYPAEARRLGIEGEVAVRLLVDESGRVAETHVARGPGHGLNEKALELARKIRFRPALDDGDHPVSTWITWTFNFTLPR